MELDVRSDGLTPNSSDLSHIQKKLNRLEKHLPAISRATVDIERGSARSPENRVQVSIALHTKNRVLRARSNDATLRTDVDSVAGALDQQVRKFKGRVYMSEQARKGQRGGAPPTPDDIGEGLPSI